MPFLRRVLKVQSIAWALTGLALGLVPVRLMDLLSQIPVTESAWLRMLGITAVVLAMLMWLIAEGLDKVWWWAWAFVVLEAGLATLAAVNALFGLDPGVPSWPWWAIACASTVFASLDMVGLGRSSQENPQV